MTELTIKKFWQFGCWNNLNTKKGKVLGCLPEVLGLINDRSMPEENKPDLLIISGDNYYPDKSESKDDKDETVKKKLIFSEKLKQGIDYLPENIKINMILGNHDLKTNDEGNLYINDLETRENNDCQIIQLELEALKLKKNVDYFFFKSQVINKDTLLLMIDTSIYEEDSYANIYLPCYNKFFKDNVLYKNEDLEFDSVRTLRTYQLNKIMRAIERNIYIKNLIIVGHHPIYQVKYKKKEVVPLKYMSEIYIKFKPILENIYKILQDNIKYYYLCSDLHLYQKGKLQITMKNSKMPTEPKTMEIQQYIVGTGGTKLDDALPLERQNIYTENNVTYTLEEEREECGFLECIINSDNNPEFQFIPVVIDKPITTSLIKASGKKHKTKKHKTKKFKTKKHNSKHKTKTKRKKLKKKNSLKNYNL